VKTLPREAIVEIASVSETASGSSEAVVMEVSAAFEPGPGIWLDRKRLCIRTGVAMFGAVRREIRTQVSLEFARGKQRVRVG